MHILHTQRLTFDHIETTVLMKFSGGDQHVRTTRYTVPLGAIDNGVVSKWGIANNKIGRSYNGDLWWLQLKSKTNVILSDPLSNAAGTKAVDSAPFWFSDKTTALRVSDAFKHAAELCRGKEPF